MQDPVEVTTDGATSRPGRRRKRESPSLSLFLQSLVGVEVRYSLRAHEKRARDGAVGQREVMIPRRRLIPTSQVLIELKNDTEVRGLLRDANDGME
jgi:hypothetical protein